MLIEECSQKDMQALYSVFCEWEKPFLCSYEDFCTSYELSMAEPYNKVFVAKENGDITGYVQVFRILELGMPVSFEVTELIVSKKDRSKGMGAALLAKAESYAKENGGKTVILSSQLYRSRAHVFYERNGYTCVRMSKFYEKEI